jgi:3-hydroxybutyryl-CoA dehydratase
MRRCATARTRIGWGVVVAHNREYASERAIPPESRCEDTVSNGFHQIGVGDTFSGSQTITETHVVLAAGLFNDFAPLHVNEEFAQTTRYGTRIAHGTLITGMMAGQLSRHFGINALGYLEQRVQFRAPVLLGDTVMMLWTVLEKIPKERFGGGIVRLSIVCTNQHDTVVIDGAAKLIVGDAAAGAAARS